MSYQISVVIPVYNQENYLRECLDSVANQSLGMENIEVIAVNDKSTDNSLAILKEYEAKYPSFKIINHDKNQGAGMAKNTGVKNITSDYLTFLDSDDFLDRNVLEDGLNLIRDSDCDLLYFNWEIYPDDEDSIHKPKINENRIIKSVSEFPSLVFATSTGSKIFKRNLYEHVDFKETSYDDNIMSVETLLNSKRIFLSKGNGYFYRRNPDSITNKITIKKVLDLIVSISDLFSLCESYPADCRYIKPLILKFIENVLFWFYNMNWSHEEKKQIISSLEDAIGNISREDIDFYNDISSTALAFDDEILNFKNGRDSNKAYRGLAKLYVDTGNGFNEDETVDIIYNFKDENELYFNLDSFDNIRKVRFDPLANDRVKVRILNIESDSNNIKIKSANSINGLKDEYQLFDTFDPMYIMKGNFSEISYIKITFDLDIMDTSQLDASSIKKRDLAGNIKSKLRKIF